jgi:hypothetical protein
VAAEFHCLERTVVQVMQRKSDRFMDVLSELDFIP